MTNKTKIKVLEKAIALISGPEGKKRWCQGHFGEDKKGNRLSLRHHQPVRFCAAGAILWSQTDKGDNSLWFEFNPSLTKINDTQGRGAALRAMRKHLKMLKAL